MAQEAILASELNAEILQTVARGEPILLDDLLIDGDETVNVTGIGPATIVRCHFKLREGVHTALNLTEHCADFRVADCTVEDARGARSGTDMVDDVDFGEEV